MKRVLLVEDDALSRRLVTLVLEDMPIELVECANLADARAALRLANFDLLITDLMLPDGNGAELLAEISADPVLGANLRRIVFSAGVPAAARARFKELGVWLVLDKPVSINALIGCVDDLIGASSSTAVAAAVEPYRSQEAIALHAHFDGNATLFEAFGAASRAQFESDVRGGDAAHAAADRPALRRLAHSLKTVLLLLGRPDAAERAAALEAAAALPPLPDDLAALWAGLRADLTGAR